LKSFDVIGSRENEGKWNTYETWGLGFFFVGRTGLNLGYIVFGFNEFLVKTQ